MNHRMVGYLILTLGVIPTSCSFLSSSSLESSVGTSSESTSESSSISSASESSVEENPQEYLDFWQPETVLDFDLTASFASLNAIQEAYYSGNEADDDVYYPADLVITMETLTYSKTYTLDDVGIRMKGNTSRSDFINGDGALYDLIHYKISFDEFVAERRFLGMKKIDIKWNKNYDATQIKQAYSYKMFESFDVMAPKSTIAPLTLSITNLPGGGSSQNQMGLYQVIEAVDKTFIERRFSPSEAGGNLYKCTWGRYGTDDGTWTGSDLLSSGAISRNGTTYVATPQGRIGLELPDTGHKPNYKLKTNENTANFSDIVNLIAVLNSTTDYDNTAKLSEIAALVDIDNFLRYEAVSYLLGDPDDTRNNYNNYYLYFTATSKKAYFIPYDFDRCLGITKDWNPSGDAMTSVSPFSDQAVGNYSSQRNPLYKFLILSGGSPTYRQDYAEHLATLLTGEWFTASHFNAMYALYHANYEGQETCQFANQGTNEMYAPWSLNETGDGTNNYENMSYVAYTDAKRSTVTNALENAYPNLLD